MAVKVRIQLCGVHTMPSGAVTCEFHPTVMDLKARFCPDGRHYRFFCNELWGAIDEKKSKWRVAKDKIIVTLEKAHQDAGMSSGWEQVRRT